MLAILVLEKNITLSLAKKYQYSFAFNILNNKNNKNIEIDEIHKITSSNTKFLDRIFLYQSTNLLSYSQVKYKGTKFKTGYFLTNFVDEVCLFKILEIVCNINILVVFSIVHQIEIDAYFSNLRAYKVNTNKNIILKTYPEDCNGPPINIKQVINGHLFIRLKEYYKIFFLNI